MTDADNLGSSESVDMVVHVEQGHEVRSVAQLLRQAGMLVERELSRARLVGGKVPRSLISEFKKIPGVKMMRESETFQLPPFDENVPQ
jgi:hypothetical protein